MSGTVSLGPRTPERGQQRLAADALQRPLVPRYRFRAQLKAGCRGFPPPKIYEQASNLEQYLGVQYGPCAG